MHARDDCRLDGPGLLEVNRQDDGGHAPQRRGPTKCQYGHLQRLVRPDSRTSPGGNGPKSKPQLRPWIDWIHTASVQANIMRDFIKWDDEPHDVHSVEESFARGIATATSAPPGPVYLCYDVNLQEDPIPKEFIASGIGQYAVPSSPDATPVDLARIVETLRAAERPVILAGYVAETREGFTGLAQLAEMIGAPVVDTGLRHACATTHPLAGTHIAVSFSTKPTSFSPSMLKTSTPTSAHGWEPQT